MTSTEIGPEVDSSVASTLLYLSRTIWRSRRGISIFTGAVFLIAVLVGVFTTPIYRATVVAFPADDSDQGASSLAGLASHIGLGSSSALGLSGQLNSTPPIQETLALLQSRQVTLRLIHKYKILPELFYDDWDSARNDWKPPSLLARLQAWLTGTVADSKPTDDDAFRAFDDIRTVSVDDITGVVTISVEWRDPKLAADWTNELVRETDDALRQGALADSQNGLNFLEKQATQSSLSDLRDAIYDVASNEVTKRMMASVQSNFAIKVIDPAAPPDRRSWPKFGFLIVISILGGFFFGSIGAIVWGYIRELRRLAGVTDSEKPVRRHKFWPLRKLWPLRKSKPDEPVALSGTANEQGKLKPSASSLP